MPIKFNVFRSPKKKKTIKYCTIYHTDKGFIVVSMFRVKGGSLDSGEAIIIEKDNFNEIGKAVISSLTAYREVNTEIVDQSNFFFDNLKRYGYSSYSDFHKKIESCMHVEMKDQQIWFIPTEKERYGFEHKTEQAQVCAIDDKLVVKLISDLYNGISEE